MQFPYIFEKRKKNRYDDYYYKIRVVSTFNWFGRLGLLRWTVYITMMRV